jgi:hypothetical protein
MAFYVLRRGVEFSSIIEMAVFFCDKTRAWGAVDLSIHTLDTVDNS